MKVAIRPAVPSDYGFIVHSGLREIGDHHLKPRERERIDHVFKPIVDAVVRGSEKVAVACDASEPDTLVGWAIFNQQKVIFVYVSHALRLDGTIAKKLREYVAPEESCES